MEKKLISFLKHFLYVSLVSAVLFFSAIYMTVIFGFGSSPLSDIFGVSLIYYFVWVPIIIGLFSLFSKYYRKLSFKKSILHTLVFSLFIFL